jgi:hypothetical protein
MLSLYQYGGDTMALGGKTTQSVHISENEVNWGYPAKSRLVSRLVSSYWVEYEK